MPGTVTVARNSHVNKVDTALLQKSMLQARTWVDKLLSEAGSMSLAL